MERSIASACTARLVLSRDFDEETRRRSAASVDANSEHLVAIAIAASSETKLPVENFRSIPGKGAGGRFEGRIRCMMLAGDNDATARWESNQAGLDEYFAEVLRQDKAAKVKRVQSRGVPVAMTSDGLKDAPALAQADVGIAIGADSDVAAESADVILVRSKPLDVVANLQLSRANYRKMIQNLVWATG